MYLKNVLLTLLFLAASVIAQEKSDKQVAKISYSIGTNSIQRAGDVRWTKARYKTPVYEKDKIKTAKRTRCEVTFENKKVMRIGENSILEIHRDEAGEDEVEMKSGLAWLSIFLPKGTTRLNMRTPSSVCAIRGTVYRLECDDNHTAYRCYKGNISVRPFEKDGKTLSDSAFNINAGEELILVMNFDEYKKQQEKLINDFKKKEMNDFQNFIKKDQEAFDNMVKSDMEDFKKMNDLNYKQQKFDEQEDMQDDWVKWNKERDRMISGQ